jgi:protein TonB
LGELALWTAAGVLTLSVHAGAAYYLMQEPPESEADGAPPAAIMIELAALPEAANVEETVEAADVEDTEEVKSVVPEKVEEVPPEEPPQPQPEPVVEETPPEPEPAPEPPQEVAEPLPEEMPEPIEEIDPIQNQQMAALENVEVPLPVMRPPPPPVEKKVEKKEEPEKKKVERKPPPTPTSAASVAKETAKVETTQSDRTAASRNSAGLFSSAMTPAKWQSRIRSQIARKKPKSLSAGGLIVTVRFNVSESGALGSIKLLGSTGDASIDQQVIAWIERASPVTEPPPEVNRVVTLPIKIE